MAIQDLTPKKETIVFGHDSVVVPKYISGIAGGRTLDMDKYPLDTVQAGQVIVFNKTSNSYKPLKLKTEDEGASYNYDTKDEQDVYVGILYRTVAKDNPAASIMTHGQINVAALPYELPADFAAAMPLIEQVKDEEAK